jgi:hypothetical protein
MVGKTSKSPETPRTSTQNFFNAERNSGAPVVTG